MNPIRVICFLLFCPYLVLLPSAGDGGKCPRSFNCGNLGTILFPFTTSKFPDCGVLAIHGCDDDDPEAVKNIKNTQKWFRVKQIVQNPPTITIKDEEFNEILVSRSCGAFSKNYTLTPSSPFASFHIQYSLPLFTCLHNSSLNLTASYAFNKYILCDNVSDIYYVDLGVSSMSLDNQDYSRFTEAACERVWLPVDDQLLHSNPEDPFKFVSAEVPIEISLSPNCSSCYYGQGGQCRLDSAGKFYCHRDKTVKTVYIAAAAASGAAFTMLIVLACCFRRKILLYFWKKEKLIVLACCFRRKILLYFWKKENPTYQVIEAFLKERGHLPARRYSYLEVKRATNSFNDKLGQGGYGTVYKGKLHDGSPIAVKFLSELKGNGEEFINEVASISMTSHVNIVSLVGFCLEGSKRALIYEFMPNGSLEKFIYEEEDPTKLHLQLSCKTMHNIAIGVARGLEYLHRGCNTRILHFDIKPHNILLDEDFSPKISDFGLAKICPQKESNVSLFGARGTIGYIAPEVFCRDYGKVSHKSDVYSYGMMVLEMIGGRKNINVQVENSSEIYLPYLIHKRLELNRELGLLRCIANEREKEMVKKLVLVSLWCIQANPSNRPTMTKVVDMLEGGLGSLQLPPKPSLSCPPRNPAYHQTQTWSTSLE